MVKKTGNIIEENVKVPISITEKVILGALGLILLAFVLSLLF